MPEATYQSHMKAIQTANNESLKDVYLAAVGACHKADTKTQESFVAAKNARYYELNPKTGAA